MEESQAVREAWLGFCEGISRGEVERFDDIVSDRAHLIIGTAPGEMVTERERMRFGFETEGVTLESRSAQAYAEGTLGWAVDEPRFGFPDGSGFDCRVTAILRNEDDTWKIVHAHFSVGVPDEEVADLQKKWAQSTE
ncbi:MAG TPA: nuclear transport factor 2 family protein [Actinomycetota bacterium]|nr:nuclear transport factor 2 family protein [Actinomycetota bacterium]